MFQICAGSVAGNRYVSYTIVKMIQGLITQIETELKTLGYTERSINLLPPIINRITITMHMAKLVIKDGHKLNRNDQKWCEYYAQYNHIFDSEKMEVLGELYFSLIETMKKENYFE